MFGDAPFAATPTASALHVDAAQTVATKVILAGPTAGASGSASGLFTITTDGSGSFVLTPTDSSGNGTFSPTTVTVVNGVSQTFTYTPSTTGSRNISATNVGGLSGPTAISYTVATPVLSISAPDVEGYSNTPTGSFTFSSTNVPSNGIVVTPTNSLSGTWSPSTLTLTPTQTSKVSTFTPTHQGPTNALGATGTNGATTAVTVNYPIYSKITSVGALTTVSTQAQLQANGNYVLSDGFADFVDVGSGNYYVYASDGTLPGFNDRSTGTLANPVAGGSGTFHSVTISGLKDTYNYHAGGTVLKIPGSSSLWNFFHCEKYPGGKSSQFWSLISLAESTDDGLSWVDYGQLVSPNTPYSPADPPPWGNNGIDITGGACVLIGDYIYMYFHDALGTTYTANTWTGVARCSIASFLAAIVGGPSGSPPLFYKYYNGAFTEPGLGGLSSPGDPSNEIWFWGNAYFHTGINAVILGTSYIGDGYGIGIKQSFDGITFQQGHQIIQQEADKTVLHDAYHQLAAAGINTDRTITNPVSSYWLFWPGGFGANPPGSNGLDLKSRIVTFDTSGAFTSPSASSSVSPSSSISHSPSSSLSPSSSTSSSVSSSPSPSGSTSTSVSPSVSPSSSLSPSSSVSSSISHSVSPSSSMSPSASQSISPSAPPFLGGVLRRWDGTQWV